MIPIANNLYLEPITINDQDALISLMKQIYPPAYKHLWKNEDCNWYLNYCFSKKSLETELSEIDAVYCFVNYNSNRNGIIRLLHNTTINDLGEKKATFIHRIYLSNETQGKGIAKQLFNWIELETIKKGNTFLWLKAMDTQKQALKFYEKEGFKTINQMCLDFKLIHKKLRGMVTMQKLL